MYIFVFRCFGESISTLQFARQAKLIKNKVLHACIILHVYIVHVVWYCINMILPGKYFHCHVLVPKLVDVNNGLLSHVSNYTLHNVYVNFMR